MEAFGGSGGLPPTLSLHNELVVVLPPSPVRRRRQTLGGVSDFCRQTIIFPHDSIWPIGSSRHLFLNFYFFLIRPDDNLCVNSYVPALRECSPLIGLTSRVVWNQSTFPGGVRRALNSSIFTTRSTHPRGNVGYTIGHVSTMVYIKDRVFFCTLAAAKAASPSWVWPSIWPGGTQPKPRPSHLTDRSRPILPPCPSLPPHRLMPTCPRFWDLWLDVDPWRRRGCCPEGGLSPRFCWLNGVEG